MADALVSVVLEQLTSVIRREVEKEVKLVVGVREEIGKLSSALTMLQAVLDDAEEKQVNEKAVKLWLEKLKDVVYDGDDVLYEWNTRTIISQIHGVDDDVVNGGIHKKVLSYLFSPCFCFKDAVVRHDIGLKIKEVRERLNVIAEEKNQYNLIAKQSPDRPRQLTTSLIDVSKVYGRDHDKVGIMGMLFGESSRQVMPVHVISIVGTGGFGKTTLEKLILKEVKVTTAFDKTMWVCVSEPFDCVRVAKEIIEQTGKEVGNVIAWGEVLHNLLCESLRGKKFFLVLDDVWTDDANEWEPFEHALNGGASGSRVLITTRNEKHMIGSIQNHKLGVLSEADSWMLFTVIAFQGREEDLNKLEGIGRQIADKCKGVPLSLKCIASLMRFKKTKKDWNDVLTSETWNIQNVEKEILPSLFLSYYPLSSNLKQCFIYCAIFPKDTEITKNWLVKLWMAQGFLGLEEGSRDFEKIGEEYYDDLAMRSFFQDFDRDSDGNIRSCKMHDLVHDFAQYLAKSECCIMEANDTKFDEIKVRHLAIVDSEYSSIYTAKKLRTFLTPTKLARTVPIELYHQLTCLRTLDLGGCEDMVELPTEVEGLLHLRYLNLWGTKVSELPETLCNLYNLQTLQLMRCRNLQKLPDGIGKLSNLRHLEIEKTDALEYLPSGIGRLGFLRTLSKLIVGGGGSKGCKIGEVKHLNFVRGDLRIKGLERVGDMNEAAEAELEKKKDLHGLRLIFGEDTNESDAEKMEGVLKNLEPHENLEELRIKGYPGLHFPDWITRLPNLVDLTIDSCKNLRVLPDLSKLKSLVCINWKSVRRWFQVITKEKEITSCPVSVKFSF